MNASELARDTVVLRSVVTPGWHPADVSNAVDLRTPSDGALPSVAMHRRERVHLLTAWHAVGR